MRPSGRAADELREVRIARGYTRHAEGSALVEFGDTRVLCAATIEDRVPPWMKGRGRGWVTAEYGMLPRSTGQRSPREAARGRQGGRTLEIQRLIGRSLRAVVDMEALGERTVIVDCDVIQADGGTRTAAITGGYVALVDAVIEPAGAVATSRRDPIHGAVAAVSVGIYRGEPVLDLDYVEDSQAETDMNVVMNDVGGFIEIQGTAEGHAFQPRRAGRDAGAGAPRHRIARRDAARRPGRIVRRAGPARGPVKARVAPRRDGGVRRFRPRTTRPPLPCAGNARVRPLREDHAREVRPGRARRPVHVPDEPARSPT